MSFVQPSMMLAIRICIAMCIIGLAASVESSEWKIHRKARGAVSQAAISKCTMPPTELTVPSRQFSFSNETGESIEIEWLGSKSRTMFVLCSYTKAKTPGPSALWTSRDGGQYYYNDTSKLHKAPIRSDHGMLRSPADPYRAILIASVQVGVSSIIFTTSNGGNTWRRISTGFSLDSILFHPTRANLLLARSSNRLVRLKQHYSKHHLYLSQDFGKKWKRIVNDVYKFAWGSTGDKEETIYASYGDVHDRTSSTLSRSDDLAKSWKIILKPLRHFLVSTKFVFASVNREGSILKRRDLYVSQRSGENRTWFRTRMPFAFEAGSFYVMDSHEGVAFIHLDIVGVGLGTLYTSDFQGVNYAISLEHHVHHEGVTDFYAVNSMRATYITTVSTGGKPTKQLQSRISFNRGGQWHPLVIDGCKGSSDCSLHIHSMLSKKKTALKVMPGPLSVKAAHGLIIAHGSTGQYVDTNKADVYLTRNGGYTWKKVLSGIHKYVIADLGKLIVAVPITATHLQDTLYYSENFGQCWHSSKFSTVKWHFTGVLADPASLGMQVTLWGYTPGDGVWQTVTMEFQDITERKCTDEDYETFIPHLANSDNKDESLTEGCLFGTKESVRVVKSNVWCSQDKALSEVKVTSTPCSCTRADFECDYGFVLVNNKCVKDSDMPDNVSLAMQCSKKEQRYKQSEGYRRIPGDRCKGGVADSYDKWDWADCKGVAAGNALDKPVAKQHTSAGVVFIILLACVVFLVGVGVCLRRNGLCVRQGFKGSARYSRVPVSSPPSTDTDDNDDTLLDVSNPKTLREDPASTSEPPATNGH